MEKELRILLRSLPLLYALVVPLVMVFVFGGIAGLSYHGSASRPRLALMFPLFLAYLLMHFVALTCNNLGGEETGIQLYFLFSTPIRTVLKAKNLFHALIFGLEAVLMGILAGFRFGWPSAVVLEATVAWLLFALPVQLAMGNILSLCMPYRRNLGRIMRQRRGQGNALLSMLMQVPVVGLGVAVFWLCSSKGVPGMAAPVFLLLAGGAVLLWLRVLSNADAMANQRREALVATLAKVE